jgi:sugar/nucleoside kinase (ribokinase family)
MIAGLPRPDGSRTIAGIGSALVDLLLQESDDFVTASGAAKGGMTLTDAARIDGLLAATERKPAIVAGGSACNTIVGAGKLGGPAVFVGKRGSDELGIFFEQDLRSGNVTPLLFQSSSPTGRVLSIITPDAQRSMFTYLGASAETTPEEIRGVDLAGAALVHIEGYLLFNEALLRASLKAAKRAGALVSLDLASYTVVEASRAILREIIAESVDIVIANEDEARAYTGVADEKKSLAMLAREAKIAVVKVGKRGSLAAHGGATYTIERMGDGRALDTTGAGDLWASGFLYGLVNGLSIEKAGRLGSACGYEVCQVVGAQIPEAGWVRIRKVLQELRK